MEEGFWRRVLSKVFVVVAAAAAVDITGSEIFEERWLFSCWWCVSFERKVRWLV